MFAGLLSASAASPIDLPSPRQAALQAYELGRLSSQVENAAHLYPDYMTPNNIPQDSVPPALSRSFESNQFETDAGDIRSQKFAESESEELETKKWILGLGGVLFTATVGLYIATVLWFRKLEQPLDSATEVIKIDRPKKPPKRKKQKAGNISVSRGKNITPSIRPSKYVDYYDLLDAIDTQTKESTRPTVSKAQLARERERAEKMMRLRPEDEILYNPSKKKLAQLEKERRKRISRLFNEPPLD